MQYKAPIRDMKFVMHELLDSTAHYQTMDDYDKDEPDQYNREPRVH